MAALSIEVFYPDAALAGLFLEEDQVVAEDGCLLQGDPRPGGELLSPVLWSRVGLRDGHQARAGGVAVGADVETLSMMEEPVFHSSPSCRQ